MNKQIYVIDKPINWTSNDVIQKIKKSLKLKKIGHGGTLDPLATGVLIIGVNDGTKELNNHLNNDKEYDCEIQFGFETTTYDLEGEIIKRDEATNVNEDNIIQTLDEFKNHYLQIPPLFSAIKKNGVPLYKYARQAKDIAIQPREVKLIDYQIISFKDKTLKLSIKVSKGFYVRSLAHDLGVSLNSCATLTSLRRTSSGGYTLNDAYTIDEFINFYQQTLKP